MISGGNTLVVVTPVGPATTGTLSGTIGAAGTGHLRRRRLGPHRRRHRLSRLYRHLQRHGRLQLKPARFGSGSCELDQRLHPKKVEPFLIAPEQEAELRRQCAASGTGKAGRAVTRIRVGT